MGSDRAVGHLSISSEIFLTPLDTVAKVARHMDASYIAGVNNITQSFIDYAKPLVGPLPPVGTFNELK